MNGVIIVKKLIWKTDEKKLKDNHVNDTQNRIKC